MYPRLCLKSEFLMPQPPESWNYNHGVLSIKTSKEKGIFQESSKKQCPCAVPPVPGPSRSSFPLGLEAVLPDPSRPHYTGPQQPLVLNTRGAGFSSVSLHPPPHTHLPSPAKANFPFSHSLACGHLPYTHCSLSTLICWSLLPCCSWNPLRGSWEHSLALRDPSPISF